MKEEQAELFKQNLFVILCTERIAPVLVEHDEALAAEFATVTMESDRDDYITRDLTLAIFALARDLALDRDLDRDLDLALDLALARDLTLALARDLTLALLARDLDLALDLALDGLDAYKGAGGVVDDLIVDNIDATILKQIEAGTCDFDMSSWASCRGGQAIRLAPKGEDLAEAIGRQFAAAMIYAASRPGVPLPDFYATDEEAIADMQDSDYVNEEEPF